MVSHAIRLITRADDAGGCESANRAILEAVRSGIARNVSLIANGPAIRHAASVLAGESSVCFGVHATLNAEWSRVRWGPILPPEKVPSLVDENGYFRDTPARFVDAPPHLDEVMAELQAQLDSLRALGFDIRYADTHMVFEWALPGFGERYARWCEREGLRDYRDYTTRLPTVSDEPSGKLGQVERLLLQLESVTSGQYTVVGHPGYDEPDVHMFGNEDYPAAKVAADRVAERLMFTDPRVIDACRRLGVRPIRYDEADRVGKR